MILILCQSSVFDITARLIRDSLKQQGINAVITTTINNNDDYYIILGGNDITGNLPKPGHYEVYQFEQVNREVGFTRPNWFSGTVGQQYVELLKGAVRVYDYSHLNTELLNQQYSLNCKYLPLAYGQTLERNFKNHASRKNQVVFFGSSNSRRKQIFNNLSENGVNVNSHQTIWRGDKEALLNNSRIALNVHFYPEATLETTRIIELLSYGVVVISERSTDPELDRDYENLVVFCDQDNLSTTIKKWQQKSADEINSYVHGALELFRKKVFKYPVSPELKNHNDSSREITDTVCEADNYPFQRAEVAIRKDKNGEHSVLRLKPKPEIDDMPPVSIVTITRNRVDLFPLAISNYHNFNYPVDKLEWVIVDDSDNDQAEKLQQLVTKIDGVKYIKTELHDIADKRNLAVENASNEIIVHMDDDDYYYPVSIFSRVKLLLDHVKTDIKCVGCSDYGIYHLMDSYSFCMNTKHMSEASMAYYKSFWRQQPFKSHVLGESVPFLRNRRKYVMVMPFEFNLVAITHNKNVTRNFRSLEHVSNKKNNSLFKSMPFETQRLLNRIYRKLLRQQQQHELLQVK